MAEDPLHSVDASAADEYPAPLQLSVLMSYERCRGYATDLLNHYDHLTHHMLGYILSEYGQIEVVCPEVRERHVVRLSNLMIQRPTVESMEPTVRFMRVTSSDVLTPMEARNRGLTYDASVYVDVTHTVYTWDEGGAAAPANATTAASPTPAKPAMPPATSQRLLQAPLSYREVPFFKLPVMLRSSLCHTSVHPNQECPLDQGGYFIIRGQPKMMQPQKVQRINVLVVRKLGRGKGVKAEIRSLRADDKFRSTSTLYVTTEGANMKVDVPFLQKGLPLVATFRLLGVEPAQVEGFVWAGDAAAAQADDSRTQARSRMLHAILSHPLATAPLEACYDAAGAGMVGAAREKVHRQVAQQVAGELLPQVGYDDSAETRFKKALVLGHIVRHMVDVYLGYEDPDDRDFEGYKSIEMPSVQLARLLRQLCNMNLKALRKSIFQRASKRKHVDVAALMTHSDSLSRGVHKAFNEGKLTVHKDAPNANMPVIQQMTQVNPLSLQSQLTRVCIPLNKDGKYTHMRGIDPTHLFAVCPADTPESERAGLLLTKAAHAMVRVGVQLEFVASAVLRLPAYALARGLVANEAEAAALLQPLSAAVLHRPGSHGSFNPTRIVFVNGDPVAATRDEAAFCAVAREARRDHALPDEVSIVRAVHGVCVSADNGVIMFPLVYLPRLHLLPGVVAAAQAGTEELWRGMVRAGIVELVDPWEALEYRVAFQKEDVDACVARRAAAVAAGQVPEAPYSHMAIHPMSMLGTSAGLVPFSNHDQAPRISYAAAMAKQVTATPSTNREERMDQTHAYELWYPQRPVADTDLAVAKHMQEWPLGQNLIMAFAPWGGDSQEDSIVFNQATIDRGAMRVYAFRVYRSVARKKAGDEEHFEHPLLEEPGQPRVEGLRGGVCYDKLDAHGLPSEGVVVRNGDALIGKVLHTTEGSGGRRVRRDKSFILSCEPSEVYVVDRVMLTTTREGSRMVRIRVRSVRTTQAGDKAASRHGQKGTIGRIVREEDMPFVASGPNAGMRPDLIISLHAINGRMTVGKLLEIVYSSLGLVKGSFIDATPFRSVSAQWAIDELLKEGYHIEETMINGETGEVMSQPWFIGSCFYWKLIHMVLNKVTARARGLRAALTHQPLDGRANQGGQRLGEMEKDALFALGAAYTIDERTRTASDGNTVLVCTTCGHITEPQAESLADLLDAAVSSASSGKALKHACRLCGSVDKFVQMPTTYSYSKLLMREMAAMGIRVVHEMDAVEEEEAADGEDIDVYNTLSEDDDGTTEGGLEDGADCEAREDDVEEDNDSDNDTHSYISTDSDMNSESVDELKLVRRMDVTLEARMASRLDTMMLDA